MFSRQIPTLIAALLGLLGFISGAPSSARAIDEATAQLARERLGDVEIHWGVKGGGGGNPFGTIFATAPSQPDGPRRLYTMNPISNLFEESCSGVPVDFNLALGDDGILLSYSTDPNDPGVTGLWRIEPGTCAYTLVGPDPFPQTHHQVAASAYDASGRLWLRGLNLLYEIDPTSGAILQGPIDLNTGYASPRWGGDIAFDPQGRFYNMVDADVRVWNSVPQVSPAPPPDASYNLSAQFDDPNCTITGGAFGSLNFIYLTVDGNPNVPNNCTPQSYRFDLDSGTATFLEVLPAGGLRFGDSASFPAIADLSLSKQLLTQGALAPGQTIQFRLTVTNDGPRDSFVYFRDYLPVGLNYVQGLSDPSCGLDQPDQVLCGQPIGSGQSIQAIVAAQIDPQFPGGALTNYAEISESIFDVDSIPGNESGRPSGSVPGEDDDDVAIVVVGAFANLDGTKVDSVDPVNVQDEFEYRIVLTNSGPAVANNVRLTDPVPAGMTPLGYEGTDWSCSLNGQEAQCVYGNPLGVDQSTEILTLRVRADEVGLFTNTCAGESDAADGDGTPGCTEDTTVIGPELRVTKSHEPSPMVVSGFSTVILTVSNIGQGETRGIITAVDTLPPEIQYAGNVVGNGWSCNVVGQEITCSTPNLLGPGESSEVRFDITSDVIGTWQNIVAVGDGGGPPPPTDCAQNPVQNQCDDDDIPVGGRPELTVEKTHVADGELSVGDLAIIRLTVSNTGTAPTVGAITAIDTLPPALVYESGDPRCTEVGQVVTCTDQGALSPGESLTFEFNVRIEAVGTHRNVVAVGGGGDDDPPTDCAQNPTQDQCDDDDVPVGGVPALVITKTHSPDATLAVGDEATIVLTVSNIGTAATNGLITVIDSLPAGLAYLGGDASCSAAGQVVTCHSESILEVGESMGFNWLVMAEAAGTHRNVVAVGGGGDSNPPTDCAENVQQDQCADDFIPVDETLGPPPGPGDVKPVPTMGEWGVILLTIVLLGVGALRARRHRGAAVMQWK